MEPIGIIAAVGLGVIVSACIGYICSKRKPSSMKKVSSNDNFEDILQHSIP